MALGLTTMFSALTVTYADDSADTEKPPVYVVFEDAVDVKTISKEDAQVLTEAMGYETDDIAVFVCSENTYEYIDWENSAIPVEEVFETAIFVPEFSRDEDGKLVIEYRIDDYYQFWDKTGEINFYGENEIVYHDVFSKYGNGNLEITQLQCICESYDEFGEMYASSIKVEEITDVYIARIYYTTDGLGNMFSADIDMEEREYSWTDCYILPEGNDTVLNFEESEISYTTAQETTTEVETTVEETK